MGANWETEADRYDSWLASAGQSPGTRKLRAYYLERFAREHGDPWGVTVDDIAAWLGSPGWSPETRKSARSTLRGFYRWAVTTGRVASSPADLLPPVRIPRGRPNPAPEEAVQRAVMGASDRDSLMVLLGAYAGLRAAEIARLRLDDVDEDLIRVTGKGGRIRDVPTHARIWSAVEAEREQRRFGRLGDGHRYGDASSPYLFPGMAAGEHITPGAVGKILKRVIGCKGHRLRHRFATRAYAGTRDLRAVQELLGHTRPETTARYTLVPDDALRAAVDAA
jgi:integrase/recombinase XerC